MRQIESDMLKCIRNGYTRGLGNTKVIVSHWGWGQVTLFNNNIAYFDEHMIITLNDGGHRTATTKSRLNALLNDTGYRIWQKKGEWRLFYLGEDRGPFVNDTAFYIGTTL